MKPDRSGEFILLFVFLAVWNGIAIWGTASPKSLLQSQLAKSAGVSGTPNEIRSRSIIFLVFGMVFLSLALGELYVGDFKWKGTATKYNFSDIFPK